MTEMILLLIVAIVFLLTIVAAIVQVRSGMQNDFALTKVLHRKFFGRPSTPRRLLATYKKVLKALLPSEYLTTQGLLRLPNGEGEEVSIEVSRSEPPPRGRGRRLGGFVDNIMDRTLRQCLQSFEAEVGRERIAEIGQYATEHFRGNHPSQIVLYGFDPTVFVHEVFHDIQAYLYDHHPDVHKSLLEATLESKRDIVQLYSSVPYIEILPGLKARPEYCRWMQGYSLDELFPTHAYCSPYYGAFSPVVERFGWQTLFTIKAVTDAAAIHMGYHEVVPTLLTAFACGDTRVTPVLQRIFERAGLRKDFDKQLHACLSGLRASPARRSAAWPGTQAVGKGIEHPAEVLTLFDTDACDLLPSIPESDDHPTQRTASGWVCPECGAGGVHVVLTNIMFGPDDAFTGLHAYTWRKRTLALDALVCPKQVFDHLKSAAFPLLLNEATIADLKALCSSLRRQGLFDKAEIAALRMVNARPTESEPRLAYVNVLLDRLKLSRLLGKAPPHDHANDREACLKLTGEVLQSAHMCQSAVGVGLLLASARLALEREDVDAAWVHFREARQREASDEELAELDACERDLRYAESQSSTSDGQTT